MMRVDRLKYRLLLYLAQSLYDCFDCLSECEDLGGTLGYVRGRPCKDCDCWKCMAARVLRMQPPRKQRAGRAAK